VVTEQRPLKETLQREQEIIGLSLIYLYILKTSFFIRILSWNFNSSIEMSTDIYSIRLGLNSCYLIRGSSIIMVDGGMPNMLETFKRKLSKLHIHPEEIKLIILTHSHFDHAGSAKEISDFTGAKIAIHKSEKVFFEEGGFIMPRGVNLWGKITHPLFFPLFKNKQFPRKKVDIIIQDEDFSLSDFGIDGKIIHTPGHTIGSISVLLDTGEAFVGCMAHNGFPFRISPGLPIYAQDISKVKESWKILIEKGAKEIFPGHGKPFPVKFIKKRNTLTRQSKISDLPPNICR
jgi:hydroxyacylglutathione hydrolase